MIIYERISQRDDLILLHSYFALFTYDSHQVVEHVWVDVIKLDPQRVLLLPVKKTHDTCSHLFDLLIDSGKVRVCQIGSLAVYDVHFIDVAEHCGYQQIVTLVDFPKVYEQQENDVLEDAVLLAKITLLKHFKDLFN